MVKANTICVWGIGLRLAPAPFISPPTAVGINISHMGETAFIPIIRNPPTALTVLYATDEGKREGKQ
jgi:hypothetical protein